MSKSFNNLNDEIQFDEAKKTRQGHVNFKYDTNTSTHNH